MKTKCIVFLDRFVYIDAVPVIQVYSNKKNQTRSIIKRLHILYFKWSDKWTDCTASNDNFDEFHNLFFSICFGLASKSFDLRQNWIANRPRITAHNAYCLAVIQTHIIHSNYTIYNANSERKKKWITLF